MKRLRIGRISGPLNRANEGLRLLLQLLDERSEPLGLISINLLPQQRRRHKGGVKVGIDERAHPSWQHERSEEILIQPVPADDVQTLVRHGVVRSNDTEGDRNAVRQLFFFQEWRCVIPVFHRGDPIVLVADARRKLRRRNEHSVVIHKLYEVQPVLLSGADRVAHIK